MKTTVIILLLYCTACLMAEQEETRDLIDGLEDSEDLERKHRRKKKKQQQAGPCGYGGYGFGKSFGSTDYTYVSAPVMNYFFGCGGVPVAPVPQYAPVQPYPAFGGDHQGHGGHGHGGHGHGGGFGGPGAGFGGPGGQNFYGPQPIYPQQGQGFQGYNQYPTPNRPFQGAVSAAASGFGSALADYLTRPRKAQRQINQLLRPIYKLF